MGKNKPLAKKRKRRAVAELSRRRKAAKEDPDNLSVDELLKSAMVEMDSFQYEAAQKYCQAALKKEPDNVAVLETSASLCLELRNLDGARQCLGRAITLQPESGHEKYMSMAQLMEGRDSLQCYQKGIEILNKKLVGLSQSKSQETTQKGEDKADKQMDSTQEGNENLSPTQAQAQAGGSTPSTSFSSSFSPPQLDEKARLTRQVSTAYCSVAELFMTDLCDEEEAEEACKANIMKAIEVDSSNPEGYQHMASFLLVKQDMDEAKQYITKSLEVWLPQYRAVREGKANTGTFDPVEVCPLTYHTRLSTVRILIEVEDHSSAIEVLEGLLEEDDEVVDVWYLMGWSYYLQGEEQHEAAQYCLHRALQIHEESPCEDEQLVEHMKELMEELGPYIEGEESDDDNIEGELESDSEEEEEDIMDTS